MRHGDKIKNLSRTASHRKALLSNLACQLITHKRIVTSLAKAKALRIYVEPLITKAKDNTTHQNRVVFSYLQDKLAVKELFGTIAPKVSGRPGGYTRIIKLGTRPGDAAETALIELVDFNEVYGKGVDEKAQPARRTRRSGGGRKKEGGEAAADATKQTAQDATATANPDQALETPGTDLDTTAQATEQKPE
ncbi:MAG: 50S ribosomal protein L17 [Williamsia sp.]|nr:50S ribosomal protein L17 [Williamsia sp.]